jgi:hypothetical protein
MSTEASANFSGKFGCNNLRLNSRHFVDRVQAERSANGIRSPEEPSKFSRVEFDLQLAGAMRTVST